MLDSVLILNEVIHEVNPKKKASVVFKVDFEKAYDSVNWDFLLYMMDRMNFCKKWSQWIKGCLNSSTVSVLVNGSPSDEFRLERGLRQGDPLAPFLFLIVVEGLNGMMKQVVEMGKFVGARVGCEEAVDVSILQFADDTVFIGEASLQNMITIKYILRCFEMSTGL